MKRRKLAFAILLALCFSFVILWKHETTLPPHVLRERGIVFLDPKTAQPGVTLYNSRHSNKVQLISLTGEVVRSWSVPESTGHGIHTSLLDSAGNLLAISQARALVKMAAEGPVLWEAKINAHHDVVELSTGNLLSFHIRRSADEVAMDGRNIPSFIDDIKLLSPGGTVLKTYPIIALLLPHLTRDVFDNALRTARKGGVPDIFHCNGLAVAPEDIAPVVFKGDILISCRDLNLLLITDPEFTVERWSFGPGILERQHDPSFLPGGEILLFDNRPSKERSRVITINVLDKVITSEYAGEGFSEFFSKTMGGVQKLPNGNLLISLGRAGQVIEITPELKPAWIFKNPDKTENIRFGRDAWRLFRATRYPTAVLDGNHEDPVQPAPAAGS